MSRVQRYKEAKKRNKTIFYPIATFVIFMLAFVFVVDFRVNNALGLEKIRLIRFDVDGSKIVFSSMGDMIGRVDTVFLRKDLMKLRDKAIDYVYDIEDRVMETINEK